MSTRVILGESKLRARRKKQRIILCAFICGVFIFVVGGLSLLSHAAFLRIDTVSVSGAETVDPSFIEALVRKQIAGSYFFLFAKNDVMLYPKQAIQKNVLAQFPMVKSVDVHANNFDTLGITVVERQPVALWCGEQFASSTDCFSLDENGLAYAPARTDSTTLLQYYGFTKPYNNGVQFLSPDQFHSLSALVGALEKKVNAGRVSSVIIDNSGDVHLQFDDGFTLLFTLSTGGADVLDLFSIALSAAPFTSHQLSDFEYLDLRFGDKVYYKLKGK